ncbi:MAG: serine/threonine-protein kinase, partial [Planctomycetota bacterium]
KLRADPTAIDVWSTNIAIKQLRPEEPRAIRRVIGPYKLLQQIGEGGMGTVYMAEQTQPVRRRVALKIVKAGLDRRQVLSRFEAERQALAMMDHPNIAKVFDAGNTDDDRPFFVMELVHGIPATEYCDKQKLCLSRRLKLFIQACRAIQHAHQKGIIHRDIKPSNVLVTPYDGKAVVKVIDFGLAKAVQEHINLTDATLFTEFGQVVGTLTYMSPEQAEMNALDVDVRTDVYSLGVLLFELLTGTTPISRDQLRGVALDRLLAIVRESDAPRPSVRVSSGDKVSAEISQQRKTDPAKLSHLLRRELDWIVLRALEKERNRRYAGSSELADDVERYLSGDVVLARSPSTSYRVWKFVRKHKAGVTVGTVFLAMMLVGLASTTWLYLQASDQEAKARQANAQLEIERDNAIRAKQSARANADLSAQQSTILLDSVEAAIGEIRRRENPFIQDMTSTTESIFRSSLAATEEVARRVLDAESKDQYPSELLLDLGQRLERISSAWDDEASIDMPKLSQQLLAEYLRREEPRFEDHGVIELEEVTRMFNASRSLDRAYASLTSGNEPIDRTALDRFRRSRIYAFRIYSDGESEDSFRLAILEHLIWQIDQLRQRGQGKEQASILAEVCAHPAFAKPAAGDPLQEIAPFLFEYRQAFLFESQGDDEAASERLESIAARFSEVEPGIVEELVRLDWCGEDFSELSARAADDYLSTGDRQAALTHLFASLNASVRKKTEFQTETLTRLGLQMAEDFEAQVRKEMDSGSKETAETLVRKSIAQIKRPVKSWLADPPSRYRKNNATLSISPGELTISGRLYLAGVLLDRVKDILGQDSIVALELARNEYDLFVLDSGSGKRLREVIKHYMRYAEHSADKHERFDELRVMVRFVSFGLRDAADEPLFESLRLVEEGLRSGNCDADEMRSLQLIGRELVRWIGYTSSTRDRSSNAKQSLHRLSSGLAIDPSKATPSDIPNLVICAERFRRLAELANRVKSTQVDYQEREFECRDALFRVSPTPCNAADLACMYFEKGSKAEALRIVDQFDEELLKDDSGELFKALWLLEQRELALKYLANSYKIHIALKNWRKTGSLHQDVYWFFRPNLNPRPNLKNFPLTKNEKPIVRQITLLVEQCYKRPRSIGNYSNYSKLTLAQLYCLLQEWETAQKFLTTSLVYDPNRLIPLGIPDESGKVAAALVIAEHLELQAGLDLLAGSKLNCTEALAVLIDELVDAERIKDAEAVLDFLHDGIEKHYPTIRFRAGWRFLRAFANASPDLRGSQSLEQATQAFCDDVRKHLEASTEPNQADKDPPWWSRRWSYYETPWNLPESMAEWLGEPGNPIDGRVIALLDDLVSDMDRASRGSRYERQLDKQIGVLRMAQGKWREAISIFEEFLSAQERIHPPHPDGTDWAMMDMNNEIREAMAFLIKSHLELGNPIEGNTVRWLRFMASDALTTWHKERDFNPSEREGRIRRDEIEQDLIDLYTAQGEVEKANEWKEKYTPHQPHPYYPSYVDLRSTRPFLVE